MGLMQCFFTDLFELPLPPGHRFPMSKYRLLRERLVREQVIAESQLAIPPAATVEQLTRVHAADYIDRVCSGGLRPDEIRRIGFPWTPQMVERSRRSVGATVAAARAALVDGLAANLAGGTHHASRDTGQGYCVFNDAAVAIRELQSTGHIGRAAVVDCDVHHGNGTANVFAGDRSVFTFSIHSARAFPLRKPPGDLDIGLPDGTGDDAYLEHLRPALETVLDDFRPELVIYLAGADPFVGDTLGPLSLSKPGLQSRDRLVLEACRQRRIPVAITMAGGYAADVGDIVDIHLATIRLASQLVDRCVRTVEPLQQSPPVC